jgi:hypothetical protein
MRKIKIGKRIRSRIKIRRKTRPGSPNLTVTLALNPLPDLNPHLTPSLSVPVGNQTAARKISHTLQASETPQWPRYGWKD